MVIQLKKTGKVMVVRTAFADRQGVFEFDKQRFNFLHFVESILGFFVYGLLRLVVLLVGTCSDVLLPLLFESISIKVHLDELIKN